MAWRIRGVLPAQGLTSVYGPSGSGKSFLVLDLAAAVASGRDWFGYRVTSAPVVYCALEGESGIRARVAAWEKANGKPLPAGLHLVLQPFKLTEPKDVRALAIAVLGAGVNAVVIIDTLNRAAPEVDENASAGMGRVLEGATELQRATGGVVVLVHHTGKDKSKGPRGHSSLFAALDAAVAVRRGVERRSWRVDKAKDAGDGKDHSFRLEVVDLPDASGERSSSCVVARERCPVEQVEKAKVPQGKNQKPVYDAIMGLLKDGSTGMPGVPPGRPAIKLEAAVAAGASGLACPADKRTSRARDAITGLVERAVLGLKDGWLWKA